MSRYHGPATVIAGGLAIPVDADLQADHPADDLAGWRGTLLADKDADPSGEFWGLPGNRWGKLRLPDGRDAGFITTGHARGSLRMEIKGTGTEPF